MRRAQRPRLLLLQQRAAPHKPTSPSEPECPRPVAPARRTRLPPPRPIEAKCGPKVPGPKCLDKDNDKDKDKDNDKDKDKDNAGSVEGRSTERRVPTPRLASRSWRGGRELCDGWWVGARRSDGAGEERGRGGSSGDVRCREF